MAIDMPVALGNILEQLQAHPERYKWFGVWWWPVKLLMKRQGYTTAQLYMLGSYQDAITADMVPPADLQGTMRAALEEFRFNAAFGRGGGRVENPDGEVVTLFDQDAGL